MLMFATDERKQCLVGCSPLADKTLPIKEQAAASQSID